MTPDERLAQLEGGNSPQIIAKLKSGFAVMADTQFLRGYCLLLAFPKVGQLNELEGEARAEFLSDMAKLGDAVQQATGAVRINYSIYGNLDPFLHAHVFPRFVDEDPVHRTAPPFLYPPSIREDPALGFDESEHGELRDQIRELLIGLG